MTPTARQIRQISFTPDLPYSKKLALDTLKYFGSVKVFLIFSRPFWAEPNKIKAINYNSTTEKNGGSGVSDDLLRVVSSIQSGILQQWRRIARELHYLFQNIIVLLYYILY